MIAGLALTRVVLEDVEIELVPVSLMSNVRSLRSASARIACLGPCWSLGGADG